MNADVLKAWSALRDHEQTCKICRANAGYRHMCEGWRALRNKLTAIELPSDSKRRRYAVGDSYEASLRAIIAHIGDCRTCAWIGDECHERERLIETMLVRRALCRKKWEGR